MRALGLAVALAGIAVATSVGAQGSAAEIREHVSSGFMPPWHADAPHGTFLNDRRLTDAEKQTIVRWVDADAPPGDLKALPPAPRYAEGWSAGAPDAVFSMLTEYPVPATGTIEYQYFEIPTNLTEDKWIRAIEILPGAREVVHHVLVYARPPARTTPPAPGGTPPLPAVLVRNPGHGLPASPRVPGRQPRVLGALIATTAPGTNVVTFPEGTALRVQAGSVLTLQMHYTAHGVEMKDRTTVGMKFADAPPDEEIRAAAFYNGQFVIPAGASDIQVPAEIGFRDTVRVWALFPHTHVRGTRWEYRVTQPGAEPNMVLTVPRYDFNWQTYYQFAKPLEILPGGKIESLAWYDNSASNRSNPDATKDVRWGDQTWEEMQYTGFLYTINSRRRTPTPPR